MSEYSRFSDFADEPHSLEGDKVRVDDIINNEILIVDHRIKQSQYSKNKSGKYLTVQFKLDQNSEAKIFFTGSDVLIEQLERYSDKIPFYTTIKKVNRYLTFT